MTFYDGLYSQYQSLYFDMTRKYEQTLVALLKNKYAIYAYTHGPVTGSGFLLSVLSFPELGCGDLAQHGKSPLFFFVEWRAFWGIYEENNSKWGGLNCWVVKIDSRIMNNYGTL